MGMGTEGTSEGYTSFGQHTFDRCGGSDSLVEESKDYPVLYASLRNVPWFHESSGLSKQDKENDDASSSRRPLRLFADELLASKKEGGSQWMIKARASATFVPPQMPALPRDVDPRDPMIIKTLTSLEKGRITYDEACATIDEHVRLNISAREDIARQDSETEQSIIEKITENNDNEENLDPHDDRSIIDSELRQLDSGTFHDSGSHTQHDLQDPVLIARLDRVENLLERLLAYENRSLDRVSESYYPNETILSPDAPSELFSDVTEVGSRHHGSLMDGVAAAQECNTSDISRLSGLANESELDSLRKEVDILRGQLRREKDEKNSSKMKWFPSRKRHKS
jgi:polyhydroxyalkanoate synthesis regulator phasin